MLKLDEPKRKVISNYIKSLIDNEISATDEEPATPVLPSNKEEPTKTDEYSDMTLDEIIEQTRILENLAKKKLAERSYKR